MDRLGIATSLLSISSPGIHFGDVAITRDLARAVNEEGRRAVVDHPGRFGLFATLPLPDRRRPMAEIAYCSDRLDVVGFALLTNVGGTYLGDESLRPGLRGARPRRARVFIHPTSPPCWEHTALGRPRPMLEFLFDTTRAVVDLILSGVVAVHPGIEFIIPHAGATLPMVADRISVFSMILDVPDGVDVLGDLGRLHFDLAGYPLPRQLDSLLTLTSLEHLHYGSDYPFTPEFAAAASRRTTRRGRRSRRALRGPCERTPNGSSRPPSLSRVSAERIDEPIVPTVDIGDWAGGDAETRGIDRRGRRRRVSHRRLHADHRAWRGRCRRIADRFHRLVLRVAFRARRNIDRSHPARRSIGATHRRVPERLSYSLGVVSPDDLFEAFNVGAAVSDFPQLDLDPDIYAENIWPDVDGAESFETGVSVWFAAAGTVARG